MTSLNSTDFTVENKAELRKIITNSLNLECWEVENFFFDPLNCPNVLNSINLFVESFPVESVKLLNHVVNGLGPGEVLLYFLCDNLTLSGFKSQIDTSINGVPFAEVKAVIPHGESGQLYFDFRFAGEADEPNHQLLYNVRNFIDHTGNPTLLENELEITRKKWAELKGISVDLDEFSLNLKIVDGEIYVGSTKICRRNDIDFSCKIQMAFDKLSTKTPNSIQEIENAYFDSILQSNIGKHDFIFFNRKNGRAIYHGKLTRQMLSVERITQGKVKPFVNFTF